MASVRLQHVTNCAITVSTAISMFEDDCWKSGFCCGGNEQKRDMSFTLICFSLWKRKYRSLGENYRRVLNSVTFNKNAVKPEKFCISNQTVKFYRCWFLMNPQHQGNYLRTKHARPQAGLQGKRNQWQGLKPTAIIIILLLLLAGMLNV